MNSTLPELFPILQKQLMPTKLQRLVSLLRRCGIISIQGMNAGWGVLSCTKIDLHLLLINA
jgi:hypothetical protein